MAATKYDISMWFDAGVRAGATHMIVVCDEFEWEDFPVYVGPDEDVKDIEDEEANKDLQKVMEVYNLRKSKDEQLAERRAFNY